MKNTIVYGMRTIEKWEAVTKKLTEYTKTTWAGSNNSSKTYYDLAKSEFPNEEICISYSKFVGNLQYCGFQKLIEMSKYKDHKRIHYLDFLDLSIDRSKLPKQELVNI